MTMARPVVWPAFPSLAIQASGQPHHSLPMQRAYKPTQGGRAQFDFARSESRPNASRLLRTGSWLSLLPDSIRPVFPAPGNFSPARAGEITQSATELMVKTNCRGGRTQI